MSVAEGAMVVEVGGGTPVVLDRGVASSQVEVVLGRRLKQFHRKIAITAQAFGWQENRESGRDSPDGPLAMLQRN